MATKQETIEQNVRLALGDMMVQQIVMRAEMAELQERLAMQEREKTAAVAPKANGDGTHVAAG
jgi:hypothetical protein